MTGVLRKYNLTCRVSEVQNNAGDDKPCHSAACQHPIGGSSNRETGNSQSFCCLSRLILNEAKSTKLTQPLKLRQAAVYMAIADTYHLQLAFYRMFSTEDENEAGTGGKFLHA